MAKSSLMPGPFRFIFMIFFCAAFLQDCTPAPEKSKVQYETLRVQDVIDSLTAHGALDSLSGHLPDYNESFKIWKTVYADCLHDSLFSEAFYLGLQTSLWIGGISNQTAENVNKQITVLDTSANGNLLNLLAVNKSGNCFTKINLNKSLQDNFYHELISNLRNAGEYAYLASAIDSSGIIFRILTMIDYSIRPDTLMAQLNRTSDSSLTLYRKILTTPGNALLVRAGMIFGFSSEFQLNRKLTPVEEEKFKNEVYFNIGIRGERGSIKRLSNGNLQVVINRNYTIFAQFEVFK